MCSFKFIICGTGDARLPDPDRLILEWILEILGGGGSVSLVVVVLFCFGGGGCRGGRVSCIAGWDLIYSVIGVNR